MIRISIAFITLIFSSFAFANGFVGNAGGGVSINGVIYVQDLYSVSAHLNPYVGPTVDMKLPVLKNFSFPIPQDLLAKKLTDLNKAVPRLGNFLALAMNEYDWVLVDEELVLLDEGNDPVKLPAGAERVQLANRLQGLIRINSQGWSKLDDANKVALLIHEAVYSLLIPNVTQGAQTARYLTGQFFLPTFTYTGSPLAKKLRENPALFGLYVPNEQTSQPGAQISSKTSILMADGTQAFPYTRHEYFKANEKERYVRLLTRDCTEAEKHLLADSGSAIELNLVLNQGVLKARSYSYKVTENESQMAVRIEVATERTTFGSNVIKSVDHCVSFGEAAFWYIFGNK